MEITDKFFDKVLILKTRSRVDDRGRMTVTYEDDFFDNGHYRGNSRYVTNIYNQ